MNEEERRGRSPARTCAGTFIEFLARPSAFILLWAIALTAAAQTFPSKPLRVVNPAAPGGNSDIFFRLLSPKMAEVLGHNLIFDYRPGAGGVVGADIIAKSPPDGYTTGIVAGSFMINPSLVRKLPYDTVRDFTPLGLMVDVPTGVVVHPSLPVKTLKELIALAKARPGQLNYSSSGPGAVGHLSGELLNSLAKIKLVHIPYKGIGPGMIDLVAGHVQLSFASVPVILPHVRSGRLRLIAQAGAKRATSLPDLPTAEEAGVPGFVVSSNFSFVGPAGIPRPVVDRLNDALVKSLRDPANRKALLDQGAEPIGSTVEDHAVVIKSEIEKWRKVTKEAGVEPQ
jgi:tripartite-type tricarboxylate transporter receptor subunit TctC